MGKTRLRLAAVYVTVWMGGCGGTWFLRTSLRSAAAFTSSGASLSAVPERATRYSLTDAGCQAAGSCVRAAEQLSCTLPVGASTGEYALLAARAQIYLPLVVR